MPWSKQVTSYYVNQWVTTIKSQNLNASCLALQLSLPNPPTPGVGVENEDVAEAAPTGNAPTTSERSTIFFTYQGASNIRGLTVYLHVFLIKKPQFCFFFSFLMNSWQGGPDVTWFDSRLWRVHVGSGLVRILQAIGFSENYCSLFLPRQW